MPDAVARPAPGHNGPARDSPRHASGRRRARRVDRVRARATTCPRAGEIVHVHRFLAGAGWRRRGGRRAAAPSSPARRRSTPRSATTRSAIAPSASWRRSACAWRRSSGPSPSGAGSCTSMPPGERTITVIGSRLGPRGADPLPWHELADDGRGLPHGRATPRPCARRAPPARSSSTARGLETLREAGVELDALVASAEDPGEGYEQGDARAPAAAGRAHRRPGGRRRTSALDGERRALAGDAAARADQRPLRLRRQLRRRPDLRARRAACRSTTRWSWRRAAARRARRAAAVRRAAALAGLSRVRPRGRRRARAAGPPRPRPRGRR